MRCRVHGHGFTLYPPGHVPYGRKRLAAVAWDGSWEQSNQESGGEGCGQALAEERFRGTYFEAVLGVAPELGSRQRERIAAILGVPGQKLEDAARGLEPGAGYRCLGQAAVAVLQVLPSDSSLFERLAESGFWLGWWPAPRRCLGSGRPLRRTPFRVLGTRAPPSPQ